MNQADWIVLIATLTLIVCYGVYAGRTSRDLDGYFLSGRDMPWWLVLLSIMGTQASAVTFLAAPGQAYTDGMRFLQYYFGLPLAAIVICVTFVPVFKRLRIYTAYQFLEQRFDGRTRTFAALLFLLQRGLSTGISIFAPSIILAALLNWNIYLTNLVMGGLLIIYTVTGGARAVAYTQKLQMIVIFLGMGLAGYYMVAHLPAGMGFGQALEVGGRLGKMDVITTGFEEGSFDWADRYNLISGSIGGFFLLLSYFGTDQSQVGRYLTSRSVRESRLGLLMNGLVKIPVQFFILLLGVLVFTFYQFYQPPIFFNQKELDRLKRSVYADSLRTVQQEAAAIQAQRDTVLAGYTRGHSPVRLDELRELQVRSEALRGQVKTWVRKNNGDDNDTNYIFLRFVLDYLPVGLVGLLIAVIFLASWGSVAAALNSLASASVVDLHKRFINRHCTKEQDYRLSRLYTLGWGVFSILVAMFAYNIGNSLIEAVNILGSLFYGTVLGIFLVAFYLRRVQGPAVFYAAVLAECLTIGLFFLSEKGIIGIGFLWLNVVGAGTVVVLSLLLSMVLPGSVRRKEFADQ